ncbi:Mitochondrial calcium uniporter regulator 1 [Paramuricea clavata]|uniref:Mitochondrial calcium uniporter regulator 1, partial n=1 Tax=Paramuricea clavata TaxID=317549 RepID=A0A6S7FUU3_PARCT|nr:Mitochondrial calcium uniporter regulator 1 [Paramuricea clavata]
MKFSSCFSPFKWKYHHISTQELSTFHKEYVGCIRSFQLSSVSLNNINKTCGHGHILNLKKSFRNSKCTGSGFRRCFSKYVSPNKNSIYFDTHLMVTDLQKCGFSLEQSEVITSAITDIVHSAVGNVKGDSVSRVEQEQLEVRLKSLIEKVRNDMIILEKTEFVRMKDECAKLKSEVAALKLLLQEEVVKLKSSQALDTSLERSRVKEEFQFRDQKIKDNNNRIDTEVARVETKIEAQKLDLLKYLVGSVLSFTTISLAFWRFFRM